MQRGTLLVEILVAAMVLGTILLVAAAAIGIALDAYVSGNLQNGAVFLLQEELEPLITIRDKGWIDDSTWVSISKNGTYYLASAGASWALVATTSGETVGQFTRNIVISDVRRDPSSSPPDKIVDIGGNVDQSTKKIVATVSWQGFTAHSISATTYLTRYKGNLVWTQTNKADFDAVGSIKTSVASQYTGGSLSDGEVVLGAGGQGDWCKPDPNAIPAVNIAGNGVGDAVTAIEGRAFAGTGQNASGTPFADLSITNTDPPVASVRGTFAKSGTKTNAVFGESNYAYIATDTNSEEIVIIDLSNPPNYTQAGSFNASGNGNGNSVFVTSTYGYMTESIGNKLYNFNKPGSNLSLDSDGVVLDGPGNKVMIVGNYAYVAIGATTKQLDIVDISSPTNLTKVGSLQIPSPGAQGAKDLFVNESGTHVYLVTGSSPTQREFFIIDTTQKNNPQPIGNGYDTNGMDPTGLTVVTSNKAIIVGKGGEQYQVINLANESSPSRCGGATTSYDMYGVSSVIESDGDAYSYIVTADTEEFKLIQGGPGGKFATSGTFESSTFDPGYETAFNRFTAHFDKPAQTDIQFQVAVANVGGDGTCATATFTFIGPDGTSATYFTTITSPLMAGIPFGSSSGRCFRYKAYLSTSDTTQTPTLNDFAVNYSP